MLTGRKMRLRDQTIPQTSLCIFNGWIIERQCQMILAVWHLFAHIKFAFRSPLISFPLLIALQFTGGNDETVCFHTIIPKFQMVR